MKRRIMYVISRTALSRSTMGDDNYSCSGCCDYSSMRMRLGISFKKKYFVSFSLFLVADFGHFFIYFYFSCSIRELRRWIFESQFYLLHHFFFPFAFCLFACFFFLHEWLVRGAPARRRTKRRRASLLFLLSRFYSRKQWRTTSICREMMYIVLWRCAVPTDTARRNQKWEKPRSATE